MIQRCIPGILFVALAGLAACQQAETFSFRLEDARSLYEHRAPSPGGIGKIFMGREISLVMGHQGASWLERPVRMVEERPDRLLQSLRLSEGMVVADIGAGTGYFTRRLAAEIGNDGLVYAVDIQPEMLDLLEQTLSRLGIENVMAVQGLPTDPRLPEDSLDLALMVDVYHEFSHPYEMLESLCRALKPGGRLVFVEYRGEDPSIPIKPLHKMTEEQVRREAALHPLEWVQTIHDLPRQHVIVFVRRE